MATRSVIALSDHNGVHAIYCHWDGNIESVGRILQENYTCKDDIEELISNGDLSSLGNSIDECEFYTRDRNEPAEQTVARTYSNYQAMLEDEFESSDREYVYVYLANGQWSVIEYCTMETKGAQVLADALAGQTRPALYAV